MSAWSNVVSPKSRQPSIQRTRSSTLKFQSPRRQAPATMRDREGPPAAVTMVGAWRMGRNRVGSADWTRRRGDDPDSGLERRVHARGEAPLRLQLVAVDALVDRHLPEQVDTGLL